MTDSNPNHIKENPSQKRFIGLMLITAFYYFPFFYGNLVKKLNIMSRCAYGNNGKKIIFLRSFIIVFMTAGMAFFAYGFIYVIDMYFLDLTMIITPINEALRVILNATILPIVGEGGAFAIYVLILIVGIVYCYYLINRVNNQMIDLARHYAQFGYDDCSDIVYKWAEYKRTGVKQLNFADVFDTLIECHNELYGFDR